MALGRYGAIHRRRTRWILALLAGISTGALMVAPLFLVLGLARSAPQPARSAESFVGSVGVNTHLNYFDTAYGDYPLVKGKLSSLGARHIRDGAHLSSDQAYNDRVYGRYRDLHSSLGIKADLIVDPRSENLRSVGAEEVGRIARMAGGSLGSLEGPNEYDLSGDGDWADALRSYQEGLYAAARANASTEGVPVIGPSLTSEGAYAALGDLSAYVDYGNVHNYYGGRNPGTGGWGANGYGSIGWNLGIARKSSGEKPVASTETGYHDLVPSTNGHLGTPEGVAGRYVPRVYLEHFARGIARTYAYELVDEEPDPGRPDPEEHFGLVRNDGTEKPAFAALANLLGLLEEPREAVSSSFTPGSLGYSLSGDTAEVHRVLLQKRDGRFYLVLWQEVSSYNPYTRREVSVPPKQVSLVLDQPVGRATTYLPNESTEPTGSHDEPTRLELEVPDHPLVVELTTVSAPSLDATGSS